MARWAVERGARVLEVTAFASNDAAIRFYVRHGFEPYTVTQQLLLLDG
jgi:ribosomal protein S18 acetylase RimI-like enzyme